MFKKILGIFRKGYRTLNTIEISRNDLLYNYKYLSSLNKKIKVAPVIKSNGYGHGIVEVANILDHLEAPFFCVDSLYEAYELQKAKIKTPILVMGYTDPQNFKVKKLPFSFAVFDLETGQVLNKYQPNCGIHIFVDTGMNREGIPMNELPHFLEEIKKLPNIKIKGLMSHLASADNPKDLLNRMQIKNFKRALEICKKNRINPRWTHLTNSDGHLNIPYVSTYDTPGVGNLARVGLALYGISHDPNLKPILTFKSKIIQIRNLKKGDRIGYSGTFTAKEPMTFGVLPLGYYDGVDRRLSNKGWVTVDGLPCKIVGRVSMNITTVDISKIPNPKIGGEVFVYSNNRTDPNSIENVARLCKTIPYDILIHLAASTKRIIV